MDSFDSLYQSLAVEINAHIEALNAAVATDKACQCRVIFYSDSILVSREAPFFRQLKLMKGSSKQVICVTFDLQIDKRHAAQSRQETIEIRVDNAGEIGYFFRGDLQFVPALLAEALLDEVLG